jgi:hypothetical protein
MIDVGDAGLLFLGRYLKLKLVRHPVEFGDHHVELHYLPAFLVHLKALQPDEILT